MKTYQITDSAWECHATIEAKSKKKALKLWIKTFSALEKGDKPDSIKRIYLT